MAQARGMKCMHSGCRMHARSAPRACMVFRACARAHVALHGRRMFGLVSVFAACIDMWRTEDTPGMCGRATLVIDSVPSSALQILILILTQQCLNEHPANAHCQCMRGMTCMHARVQDMIAEPGRYRLYLGNACPWCHRVHLAYVLRGFSPDKLPVTQVRARVKISGMLCVVKHVCKWGGEVYRYASRMDILPRTVAMRMLVMLGCFVVEIMA